jgi:alkylation response protein AidB-like acyl-CoA dehydrogenase
MDLDLSEFQSMLVGSARDFLANECPPALVREAIEREAGFSRALWDKVCELGWPGLLIDEAWGGSGAGVFDMLLLAEECGRALAPLPLVSSALLCAPLIQSLGSEAQKQRWLPGLASGATIAALAQTEPSARFDAEGISLRAQRQGSDWLLDGVKLFVRDGAIADLLVVVARCDAGISLFLVPADAPGLVRSAQPSIGADRQAELRFAGVRVGADSLLGAAGAAWPQVADAVRRGTLAECFTLAGVADVLAARSVAYAKERQQFGRAIGGFQAIAHMCANLQIAADSARLTSYWAASDYLNGVPGADASIARAKAWTSERVMLAACDAQHIHAGVAYIKLHDLHFWYDRAKCGELYWDDAERQREGAAAALLDG